jgi:hypothetical protein
LWFSLSFFFLQRLKCVWIRALSFCELKREY